MSSKNDASRSVENPAETPNVADIQELLSEEDGTKRDIILSLLRTGDQMILSAAPKTGKSFLAQEIALSLARPFKGHERRWLFAPESGGDTPFEILRPKASSYPDYLDGKPMTIITEDDPEYESLAAEEAKKTYPGWRVLFFSLEMDRGETTRRLRKQLPRWGINTDPISDGHVGDPAVLESWAAISLKYCFGFLKNTEGNPGSNRQSLDVVDAQVSSTGKAVFNAGADARRITQLIEEYQADIVIYDTLIQLHSLSENDNVMMKAVLQKLRDLSWCGHAPVAHIVVHHTRKENPAYRGPLTPEMMRGAGSVHAAADVVMLARAVEGQPEFVEMNVSSRSSQVDGFVLKRSEQATFEWTPQGAERPLKKGEQKDLAFEQAILGQLEDAGEAGALLDRVRLATAIVALKEKHAWNFVLPKGDQATVDQVERLVRQGKIEWAYAIPKGQEANLEEVPLRLPSPAPKGQWRKEVKGKKGGKVTRPRKPAKRRPKVAQKRRRGARGKPRRKKSQTH